MTKEPEVIGVLLFEVTGIGIAAVTELAVLEDEDSVEDV